MLGSPCVLRRLLPVTAEAAPTPPTPKSRGRRFAIGFGIVVAVMVVYALSLSGVHLLAISAGRLPAPDLGTTADTVVLVGLEELKTDRSTL